MDEPMIDRYRSVIGFIIAFWSDSARWAHGACRPHENFFDKRQNPNFIGYRSNER
jgi:hypothetical protein